MLSRIEMDYVVLYWKTKVGASVCLHQLVKSSKAAETDHLFPFTAAT